MKLYSKITSFHSIRCIWKYRNENGAYAVGFIVLISCRWIFEFIGYNKTSLAHPGFMTKTQYFNLIATYQQISETSSLTFFFTFLSSVQMTVSQERFPVLLMMLQVSKNQSAIAGRNLPRIAWRFVFTYGPIVAKTFFIVPAITESIIHIILVTPVVWLVCVPVTVGKLFPIVVPHKHTFLCYVCGPQPKSFIRSQPQLIWNRTVN